MECSDLNFQINYGVSQEYMQLLCFIANQNNQACHVSADM